MPGWSGAGTASNPYHAVMVAGATATIDLAATDEDDDAVAIGCSDLPGWADLDDVHAKVVLTPGDDDVTEGRSFDCSAADATTSSDALHFTFEVDAVTPAANPPGAFALTGAVAGNATVSVSWGASADATGYKVERGTAPGTYGTEVATSTQTPFLDTTVVNGTTYYYRVTAIGVGGTRKAKTTIKATPVAPVAPLLRLDADDFNGDGARDTGDKSTSVRGVWASASTSAIATLASTIARPATITSGWAGTGIVADPYRIRLDGIDDRIDSDSITNVRTYSVWFKGASNDVSPHVLFSKCNGTSSISSVKFSGDNQLTAAYAQGGNAPSITPPLDRYNHVVITYLPGVVSFYLNGHRYAHQERTATEVDGIIRFGQDCSGTSVFALELSLFQALPGGLTADEVADLYASELPHYVAQPTTAINEVRNAQVVVGDTSSYIDLFGTGYSMEAAVTVGGQAADDVVFISANHVKAHVPQGSYGLATVAIANPLTASSSNALRYVHTRVSSPVFEFDASNPLDGGVGKIVQGHPMASLAGSSYLGIYNVAVPASGTSGWSGSGTPESPRAIDFDGADDYGSVPFTTDAIRTYVLWFSPSITGAAPERFFSKCNGTSTISYAAASNDVLSVGYAQGAAQTAQLVPDSWHQLVLSYDGAEVRTYLDEVMTAIEPRSAAVEVSGQYRIGQDCSGTSVAAMRLGFFGAYTGTITEDGVRSLYYEQATRYGSHTSLALAGVRGADWQTAGSTPTLNLYGWNLQDATGAMIGNTTVAIASRLSPFHVTVAAPVLATGRHDVKVTGPASTSSTLTGAYFRGVSVGATRITNMVASNPLDLGYGVNRGDVAWRGLGSNIVANTITMAHASSANAGWHFGSPSSLMFNGTHQTLLAGQGEVKSYVFWFRAGSSNSSPSYIFSKCNAATVISFAYLTNGLLKAKYAQSALVAEATYVQGIWHQVAITNNGSQIITYLDGEPLLQESRIGATEAGDKIYLGSDCSGTGMGTDDLASFTTFNGALTADEIAQMYEVGAP